MLVAVAVIASAMYVAASPASQQSRGPTAKQYRALKRQVAKMSRVLKTVKRQAQYARDYVHDCLRSTGAGAVAVSEFGDPVTHKFGYSYFDGTSTYYTSALDIDTNPSSTTAFNVQKVARACANR
ncbi:MAG TPA: hypothetical protein VJV76_00230 [Gaiellaceae bacterium]|nr:hypothetical protein [Gaiellaceae bacterium]